MKSKVTFDLDYSNQPVVRASIQHSEDVRDTIAERFKGGFAHESNIAVVYFEEGRVAGESIVEILPLSPYVVPMKERLRYISTEQMKVLVDVFKEELVERDKLVGVKVAHTS